uniref:Uncharacterized protein n=1 Tax=Arundo donax TaxID=35708 RepID=A0A0A9BA47_ARUDO
MPVCPPAGGRRGSWCELSVRASAGVGGREAAAAAAVHGMGVPVLESLSTGDIFTSIKML